RIAVLVVEARLLAPGDEDRVAADSPEGADGRVHAAREQRLCTLEFAPRLLELQGRHGGQVISCLPVEGLSESKLAPARNRDPTRPTCCAGSPGCRAAGAARRARARTGRRRESRAGGAPPCTPCRRLRRRPVPPCSCPSRRG